MIFIISYNKKVNFDEIEYNTFKIFMPFLTVFLRSMTRYIDKKLMDNLVVFFNYEIDESNFAIAMIYAMNI